jgi:hypothetical protein
MHGEPFGFDAGRTITMMDAVIAKWIVVSFWRHHAARITRGVADECTQKELHRNDGHSEDEEQILMNPEGSRALQGKRSACRALALTEATEAVALQPRVVGCGFTDTTGIVLLP